ncbi:MAG: M12 family metallopeptidase, partial [Bryobacteraceae bacterium]
FHEQARQDRDFYLRVLYQNMDKRQFSQYNQHISDGVDVGSYDYGSIMHYSVSGFSRNGLPVMESIPRGIPIGQRDALSPGDVDALKRLYGRPVTETVVDTVPAGLDVIVDGERYQAPKSFEWAEGTTHTIEAPGRQGEGNTRHLFARWSDNGERLHTIKASSVGVYTANYIRQHRVPFTAAPAQGGSLRLSEEAQDGYFTEGTVLEVTAFPSEGYHFAGWGGRGFFSIHGTSPNPLRFTVRPQNLRYTASFTRSTPTFVTSDPPGLEVLVDGEKTTTPEGFLWDPGTVHTISVENATQTHTSETARYLFRGWSDSGGRSHEVTAGTEGGTYTARFQTQYLVTWSSVPGEGGTLRVSPFSADGFYDSGSTLQFSPLASGPFRFAGWSNDLSGSPAPGLLLVDDQKLVTGIFAVPGQLAPGGVVNAASFSGGAVAPGEIVTVFGLDFGPETLTTMHIDAASSRVRTALAGVSLLFDGVPAPLIYVSGNQVSAVVPYSVAGKQSTRVQLEYRGRLSEPRLLQVAPSAPALFTFDSSGRGPAAALNQNGSVNTSGNPAVPGSVVVLYATGEGQTEPGGIDGKPGAGALPKPKLPVRVRIAGRDARIEYAGGAPGLVAGVMQVNARIPEDCPSGAVPVVLTVGEASSPASVTIAVQ